MTRLMELLLPTSIIGFLWLAVVSGLVPLSLPNNYWIYVNALPLYFIIAFGCYALFSVGYSVYNVKSDDGAAQRLLEDIHQATHGLKEKGFKFD